MSNPDHWGPEDYRYMREDPKATQLRVELDAAINTLPKRPKETAEYLRLQKITGVPRDATCCPIALYLRGRMLNLYTDGLLCVLGNGTVVYNVQRRLIATSRPWLRDFIDDFDHGFHRELYGRS